MTTWTFPLLPNNNGLTLRVTVLSGRFIYWFFGQENWNTKTRLLLWSADFPEHSGYRHFSVFVPAADHARDQNKQVVVSEKLSTEGRALQTSFNLCSVRGGAAFPLLSGGVTLGIRSWNVLGMWQELWSKKRKKHHRELFNLNSNSSSTSLSFCFGLFFSLFVSLY